MFVMQYWSEMEVRSEPRNPAEQVTSMVDHVLELAGTWVRWDGKPLDVPGPEAGDPPRTYTPHKAIRRVADHLLDHLAQVEALLAGRPSEPDQWHGSGITTKADVAPFTSEDLDEARSRLTRLSQLWEIRLRGLDSAEFDRNRPGSWSLSQIIEHVAESSYYADSVGAL
jgi:hypothetical protein